MYYSQIYPSLLKDGGGRQLVLDIFQRMAYSHTAEDYSELRRQLHETGLDSVVTYFEANWHPLRAEWANCFLASGTFGNRTNNRLESINQKIKSLCSAYGNLNDFFRELRTVLACLRVERDNVALNCVSKVSLCTIGESVAAQYSRLLLPYPAGLVRTELARSEDVKVVDNQISGVIASSDGCTCRFHAGMHMPCRHMFAMRRVCGLHLCDDTLTDERWHVAHYHAVHSAFKDCTPADSAAEADVTISAVRASSPRRPSTFAKFNAAKHVCMRLAGLASEACRAEYDARMSALRSLLELWNSPADDALRPADDALRPADDALRPADDALRPADDALRPADDALRPADDALRPADDALRPPNDALRPPNDALRPADDAFRPPDDAVRPADDALRPADDALRPADDAVRPVDDALRPADDAVRTADDAIRPADDALRPADDALRPPDDALRPQMTLFGPQMTLFALQMTLFALQVTLFGPQMTLFGQQMTLFALQMTRFALQMTLFALQMTLFALQMTLFGPQMTLFALQMMLFRPQMTLFGPQMTLFALQMTLFALQLPLVWQAPSCPRE